MWMQAGRFKIQKQGKYQGADLKLNASSSAMEGLGYTKVNGADGKEKTRVSIDEFNKSISDGERTQNSKKYLLRDKRCLTI